MKHWIILAAGLTLALPAHAFDWNGMLKSVVGQARTLASLQGDMAVVRPALEMVHHVGEAGTAFGEVGRIDLGNVAQAHHLGTWAGTGDQRLHLLGREVLRLVDDEKFVEEGTAAHEVERLDLDARTDQV